MLSQTLTSDQPTVAQPKDCLVAYKCHTEGLDKRAGSVCADITEVYRLQDTSQDRPVGLAWSRTLPCHGRGRRFKSGTGRKAVNPGVTVAPIWVP